MATKITAEDFTGNTLYFIVRQDATVYTGTSGGAWSDGSYSGYAVTMSESGASGFYSGTFPAVAAGIYNVTVYRRDGGSVAITDTKLYSQQVYWDGSALIDYSLLTTIDSKTTNLPSDPADASDIASSFSTVNSTLSTIAGYIDTEIAAIKAKTDNLPSDPADASVIAGRLDTIDTALAALPTSNGWGIASVAGVTPIEALRRIGAVVCGENSGVGTGTEIWSDWAGTPLVTIVVTAAGLRTDVTFA